MLNGVNSLIHFLMSSSILKVSVVADALSYRCMLVTQLELNGIGCEYIKDLYVHDPTFAIT